MNSQLMIRRRAVALLVETSNAYSRGLLDGVIDYIRHHQAWSISLPEQERGARPPKWLSRWRGDGIIARIETDEIGRAVRRKKLPVVDVSAARHVPGIPWVETDDQAVAQLAAEHLLDRGFQHLAFFGDVGFNWSVWRRQHFENIVRDAGAECHVHETRHRLDASYSWNREKRRLTTWLKRLPRPVGIMACYDIQAQQLLDVCRELEIAVPEEAAVIGVDNDRLLCDLADPPLSSVICSTHRTGYEAASLLDRMMSGESVPPAAHLIKPLGIETRQSTDILAIDDPD
ncbi:MAG: XylR family transcriptional regulator, partial [Bythopirellula sp.]